VTSKQQDAVARVLVVAAHPDDEILGCGGTIARHTSRGDEVSILILGEGITSRAKRREPKKWQQELKRLREQVNRAAAAVGAGRTFHHDFPDNRFDSVDLLDLIKVVEETKSKVNPTIVYTHHGGDLNIDHRMTFQAVLTACRPQPGEGVRTIYSFEIASSTEWNAWTASNAFLPNVYVDITKTLQTKLKAMSVYSAELRKYPHPRSLRALEVMARRNGVEAGIEAAERFSLIRSVL
jgi:LmbE family N-acetylglucosaminyl deacetylase